MWWFICSSVHHLVSVQCGNKCENIRCEHASVGVVYTEKMKHWPNAGSMFRVFGCSFGLWTIDPASCGMSAHDTSWWTWRTPVTRREPMPAGPTLNQHWVVVSSGISDMSWLPWRTCPCAADAGLTLTLKALKQFLKTMETKVFFSIWNYHKCLSQFFLIHLNTYGMGLRPLEICFTLLVRGSTLAVRIWRLQTSDSDTKICLRAVRVYPAFGPGLLSIVVSFSRGGLVYLHVAVTQVLITLNCEFSGCGAQRQNRF